MLAAMALAATLADCVPMRWIGTEPALLKLVEGTAVNCLLLEEAQWGKALLDAGHARGLRMLAVVRTADQASQAAKLSMDGVVLEGSFGWTGAGKMPVIRLAARKDLRFDSRDAVIGTVQGVWPGLEEEHGNAAPTGAAWIHTNTGFLRYVRSASTAAFWMANTPGEGEELTAQQYTHAVADAAAIGARWVIALDAKMRKRLMDGEATAVADWKTIAAHVGFYESHKEWRTMKPWAEVAIVQDEASGALVTGNLLDMLAVMNTPVRAVPSRVLSAAAMEGTKVTVTVNASAYTPEQRELIEQFAGRGGKVVSGPQGWKMPETGPGRITFEKAQYKDLEAIWPELHVAVQRKNFGVRMFNVAGVLSYLIRDDARVVLQLVNYTDYPAENITAIVQGKYKSARLLTPDGGSKAVVLFDAPEGTGVEVDKLGVCGALVLEPAGR